MQRAVAELLDDIDGGAQTPRGTVARAEQREAESEIVARETDRLDQVGTRMPVRSLARLIEVGETPEVLREDYPFLPEESFELAPLWATANPRQGRPSRPWNPGERTPARTRAALANS